MSLLGCHGTERKQGAPVLFAKLHIYSLNERAIRCRSVPKLAEPGERVYANFSTVLYAAKCIFCLLSRGTVLNTNNPAWLDVFLARTRDEHRRSLSITGSSLVAESSLFPAIQTTQGTERPRR